MTDLFNQTNMDHNRIIRELRKAGKLEQQRMRKGHSYLTWEHRGALLIEQLLLGIRPDKRHLEREEKLIIELDKVDAELIETDAARRYWKAKSLFMSILVITETLLVVGYALSRVN
jgi:hypothetical protein